MLRPPSVSSSQADGFDVVAVGIEQERRVVLGAVVRAQSRTALAPALDPFLPGMVDDFYAEIDRHPDARKVITGGAAQVALLKGTLVRWLRELLSGPYDRDYVARRWQVGWRHVEIGLDQVYTNVALSRVRCSLLRAVQEIAPTSSIDRSAVHRSPTS